MDERGLKVYEYNADSASCHAETGVIINKWAKQGGLTEGWDRGTPVRNAGGYLETHLGQAVYPYYAG